MISIHITETQSQIIESGGAKASELKRLIDEKVKLIAHQMVEPVRVHYPDGHILSFATPNWDTIERRRRSSGVLSLG